MSVRSIVFDMYQFRGLTLTYGTVAPVILFHSANTLRKCTLAMRVVEPTDENRDDINLGRYPLLAKWKHFALAQCVFIHSDDLVGLNVYHVFDNKTNHTLFVNVRSSLSLISFLRGQIDVCVIESVRIEKCITFVCNTRRVRGGLQASPALLGGEVESAVGG